MSVSRYVIVSTDNTDKVIKDGPFVWDGVTSWSAPTGRTILTESAALLGGYSYPLPQATDVNAATLRSRATSALTANGNYLAIGTPTNAQVAAQVTALTKECSGIIRLMLGQFDDITGT